MRASTLVLVLSLLVTGGILSYKHVKYHDALMTRFGFARNMP